MPYALITTDRLAKRPKQAAAAAAADNYKRQNNYSHTVEAKTKQKKTTYSKLTNTTSLLRLCL